MCFGKKSSLFFYLSSSWLNMNSSYMLQLHHLPVAIYIYISPNGFEFTFASLSSGIFMGKIKLWEIWWMILQELWILAILQDSFCWVEWFNIPTRTQMVLSGHHPVTARVPEDQVTPQKCIHRWAFVRPEITSFQTYFRNINYLNLLSILLVAHRPPVLTIPFIKVSTTIICDHRSDSVHITLGNEDERATLELGWYILEESDQLLSWYLKVFPISCQQLQSFSYAVLPCYSPN